MTISSSDKRWLRKMIREEFKELLADVVASESKQIGGYDGATPFVDPDEYEGRTRVGFHVPNRSDS